MFCELNEPRKSMNFEKNKIMIKTAYIQSVTRKDMAETAISSDFIFAMNFGNQTISQQGQITYLG